MLHMHYPWTGTEIKNSAIGRISKGYKQKQRGNHVGLWLLWTLQTMELESEMDFHG